jgi:hypothetical protein
MKCRATAQDQRRPGFQSSPPFRDFAPFGISRRSGFRAVRDFAPFGISRRPASRLWLLLPSALPRRVCRPFQQQRLFSGIPRHSRRPLEFVARFAVTTKLRQ